jgi:hypothetical protein
VARSGLRGALMKLSFVGIWCLRLTAAIQPFSYSAKQGFYGVSAAIGAVCVYINIGFRSL